MKMTNDRVSQMANAKAIIPTARVMPALAPSRPLLAASDDFGAGAAVGVETVGSPSLDGTEEGSDAIAGAGGRGEAPLVAGFAPGGRGRGDRDLELHAGGAVAGDAAGEVALARGGELDGGGAAGVGLDGVGAGAGVV